MAFLFYPAKPSEPSLLAMGMNAIVTHVYLLVGEGLKVSTSSFLAMASIVFLDLIPCLEGSQRRFFLELGEDFAFTLSGALEVGLTLSGRLWPSVQTHIP